MVLLPSSFEETVVLLSSRCRAAASRFRELTTADATNTALPQNSNEVEISYLKTQGDSSKGRIFDGVLRRCRALLRQRRDTGIRLPGYDSHHRLHDCMIA